MSALSWIPATPRRALLRTLALASFLVVSAGAAGCAAQQRPSLRVVAVEKASSTKPVLLVQVTNPERRPIRLQRLEYTFASAGAEHKRRGEVLLSRDVAAGAAVVVEVPIELSEPDDHGPFTLEGSLTALIDRIQRVYPITVPVTVPVTTPDAAPAPIATPVIAPLAAPAAVEPPPDAPK